MEHPTPNPPEPGAAGHEVPDAPVRPIVIFLVAFVLSLAIVHVLGWVVWVGTAQYQTAENRGIFSVHPLSTAMPTIPPEPRLEPSPPHDVLPREDLKTVQAHEQ